MKLLPKALLTTMFSLAAAGCGDTPADEQPVPLPVEESGNVEQHASVSEGKRLFEQETFGGNGRTCNTCHTNGTGTLSPQQAQTRYNAWQGDPLFRPIDSDGGNSTNYSALLADATVNVEIPLHPNVRLASDPTKRTITLRRGIPTTNDAPFFDTMLMFDGRAASLEDQAHGAIMGHAEAARAPTLDERESIAKFERTLFSSEGMRRYAENKGPLPAIPAGVTASEKRGRAWFEPTALCGSCHNGPLLNTMLAGNPMGLPAGTQFGTALVSDLNLYGKPQIEFIFTKADGSEQHLSSKDPGLALITGDPATANLFKMHSLRNLKNTAPYFSDNSAKTIEDIMVQYRALMVALGIPHTDQDVADLTAYLKLM